MQLSQTTRLALIITAGAVVVAVVVAAVWSGATIDAVEVLKVLGAAAGGLLAGLGLAGGPSRGAGAGAAILLILPALALSGGCSGWQSPGPEGACETETRVVDGLEAARVALAVIVPEIPADIMADLESSIAAGRALVATCEAARDRAAWQAWIAPALALAQRIAEVISRHVSAASLKAGKAPAPDPAAALARERVAESIELLLSEQSRLAN